MNRNEKIAMIIDNLQPNMEEYADNAKFYYWMDYACELDHLLVLGYQDDPQPLIQYVNKLMTTKLELSPEHHACVDVATSLEAQMNEFKGVFTYA